MQINIRICLVTLGISLYLLYHSFHGTQSQSVSKFFFGGKYLLHKTVAACGDIDMLVPDVCIHIYYFKGLYQMLPAQRTF